MQLFYHVFVGMLLVCHDWTRSSYVIIPWSNTELVQLSREIEIEQPLLKARIPRQAMLSKFHNRRNYYQTQPSTAVASQVNEQNNFNSHEYVDYGAHTGNSGSFGWYADFPVH